MSSAGGILLPSSGGQKPGFVTGEIVAVGADVQNVKKGDRVLAGSYGGTEVSFEGRAGKFILDADVLGVLQ